MDNENLISVLKQIAVDSIQSLNLMDWSYARVINTKPLRISLSDKLVIGKQFIEFGNYNPDSLDINDKLILLKKQGGQLYLLHTVIRKGD